MKSAIRKGQNNMKNDVTQATTELIAFDIVLVPS